MIYVSTKRLLEPYMTEQAVEKTKNVNPKGEGRVNDLPSINFIDVSGDIIVE